MREERRNYSRFNFESNIIAIGFGMIGKVTDASLNGIGIKYNKRNDEISYTTNDILIFRIDKKNYVKKIQINVKLISDINITDDKTIHFNRRCGFQFVDFSKNQLSKLENFLDRPLK